MLSQASHVFKCKPVRGIIHIGCSNTQQSTEYQQTFGLPESAVVSIDALIPTATLDDSDQFIAACCWSSTDIKTLYITNYKGCSGLYPPSSVHQSVVEDLKVVEELQVNTINLDKLFTAEGLKEFNMLILSVNGAELDVLKGAEQVIQSFDYVLVTIFNLSMYTGASTPTEVSEWMKLHNFELACSLKPQTEEEKQRTVIGSEKALYVTKELKTIYMTNKLL